MSNRRQVLHIGLGSEACELTAHLVNLHGLAATTEVEEKQAFCDLDTSHSVYNKLYVPRVLFIDEGRNLYQQRKAGSQPADTTVSDCWQGETETIQAHGEPSAIENDAFDDFLGAATSMATSQYSRYRCQETYTSTSRHVNWDEEDVIDESDAQQEKDLWKRRSRPQLQSQLEEYWESIQENKTPSRWINFLSPPYHPKSLLSLSTTSFDTDYDHYYYTHNTPWLENDCIDRVRWMLEECDSCQGVVMASSVTWGNGLATALLQEFEQEVPSASRLMITLSDDETGNDVTTSAASTDSPSWHSRRISTVRKGMQNGLALAEHSQYAHAVLPLSNRIQANQLAAAMEAVTLNYRLRPSESQQHIVGINSYYSGSYGGGFPFGTVPNLSFSEFLTTMKPSNAHVMLELDALLPDTPFSFDNLRQGTSVERDMRMKNSLPSKSKDELPGLWMTDISHGGILSSCSPRPSGWSLHNHFCLSSAMRPASSSVSILEYARCLMEGIGIRFRPEQSLATIVHQSLYRLTDDGYSAGSYWKSLYNLKPQTDVLAVLGNSTRSFPYLRANCTEMKTVFSPSYKGLYNRDVATGLLPELEDAEHALSTVYHLRDTYKPSLDNDLETD